MAHLHEVKDSDTHFIIDPVTMAISNAQNAKNEINQGDHNSEIFTFQIPKVIEGHDMTLCDAVRVHFINTGANKADVSKDIYKVKDLAVAEDNAEMLLFSWTIEGAATLYNGSLNFRILFACTDGNGGYDYKKWTDIYKGITIGDGFDNSESVYEEYSDILQEWHDETLAQYNALSESIKNVAATAATSEANAKASAEEAATHAQRAEDIAVTVESIKANNEAYTKYESDRKFIPSIVQTVEGENIVVADSANTPFQNLKLFGKSEQETTKGNQLIPFPYKMTNNSDGTVTWTLNEDGSITAKASSTPEWQNWYTLVMNYELPAGTCTLTGCPVGGAFNKYWMYVQRKSDNYVWYEVGNGVTFTVNEGETFDIVLNVDEDAGSNINVTFKPMLNVGEIALPWEKYTGGKAAPSPEYQQEIASVENPVVGVCGANLIDAKSLQVSTNTSLEVSEDGYTIKAVGGTASGWCSSFYELPSELVKMLRGKKVFTKCDSFVSEQSATGARAGFNVTLADGTTVYPASVGLANMAVTETINKNAVRIVFGVYANNSGKVLESDNTITIKGLRVSILDYIDWKPYKKFQSLSLPYTLHGIPVASDGNYTDADGQQWICDEVDLERGVFIQRVNVKTFSGSDNETWQTYAVKDGAAHTAYQESVLCKDIKVFSGTSSETSPLLSDKFVAVPLGKIYSDGKQGIGISSANPTIRICVDACNGYSLSEFVSWLNENPFELIYPLATPIETPLTADEITAYKNLVSNYPNTVVLNDAGAWTEVSYNVDTELFILNNRVPASDEQIENAVNAYLEANPVSIEPFVLTDTSTNKKYQLYVDSGSLKMKEVTG